MDTNSLQIKVYAQFFVLPEITGGVFDVPDRYYQDSGRELIFCAGVGRSIGGGTADADIGAPEAWAITTSSSSVIVAVVDTGVDYIYLDLAASYVGGLNTITGTTNPMDDHGTHCAGTIAGIGNNGVRVAEVTWSSRIIPLKFLDSGGSGYTSDAIEAFTWGYAHGARIISNSWGGSGADTALHDEINAYPEALFVCAAGNLNQNTDTTPQSPSALPDGNILAVAATDSNCNRAPFSKL